MIETKTNTPTINSGLTAASDGNNLAVITQTIIKLNTVKIFLPVDHFSPAIDHDYNLKLAATYESRAFFD